MSDYDAAIGRRHSHRHLKYFKYLQIVAVLVGVADALAVTICYVAYVCKISIIVEVSVGELLDKISILEIKKEMIKDSEKLKFINDEYKVLKEQLNKNVKSDEKLTQLFQTLKNINSKLWIIEDDKRLCEKKSDFGENFIRLSRDVHFLNDTRAKIKLEINNHTGSKIKEIKEYTIY